MARKRTVTQMEEVTDFEAGATPRRDMDLVGGLVFVTFFALLVGIVLSQLALKKYFDAGLFG